MPDFAARFFSALSPRVGLGVSTDFDDAAFTGELEVSGLGLLVASPDVEISLSPDVFVSGRTREGDMPFAATVGAGLELAIMPLDDRIFFNPVVRVTVGGAVTMGPDRTRPALRAAAEVDIPVIATNLDLGAWVTVSGAYVGGDGVDNDARFTLGFRFALPATF